MTFSILNTAKSLAEYLAPLFPGVSFYEDPNQQGTRCPCFFLQQRDAETSLRTGGRFLRRVRLDLTYLEDYHLPDLQRRYEAAAQILDRCMETFPYVLPGDASPQETTLLRTYDRSWRIDPDALHYRFELQVWEVPAKEGTPMQSLADSLRVKEAETNNGTRP